MLILWMMYLYTCVKIYIVYVRETRDLRINALARILAVTKVFIWNNEEGVQKIGFAFMGHVSVTSYIRFWAFWPI